MSWSLEQACWNALLGHGLHPYSLWLLSAGLPTLALFWNLRQDESAQSWCCWVVCGLLAVWTLPPETLGLALVDVGKFRSGLANILPLLPQIGHHLPKLISVAYPIMPKILPHMGMVWPHLHLLLPHAELLTRIIPKLSSRIEDLLPLVNKIGPVLAQFTPKHMEKLELIIDDVVLHLDALAPHIDKLMPVLADGLLVVTPALLQHIEEVLPYLDQLEKDLNWLLPFAEIDGVEELLPLLDMVAPKIQRIQPFAEALAPLIPKIRPLLPHLVNNLDVLMDEINQDVMANLDPMLYWCGRFLPMANSMGILRSRTILRAFMPMGKFLPPVPVVYTKRANAGQAEGERVGSEWWRHSLMDRQVSLGDSKLVGTVVYYSLLVDNRYAGEFRFKHLRELHLSIAHLLADNAPSFPPRLMTASPQQLATRRAQLQRYLEHILYVPEICSTNEFVLFIRIHRRWANDIPPPVLFSPLLSS